MCLRVRVYLFWIYLIRKTDAHMYADMSHNNFPVTPSVYVYLCFHESTSLRVHRGGPYMHVHRDTDGFVI